MAGFNFGQPTTSTGTGFSLTGGTGGQTGGFSFGAVRPTGQQAATTTATGTAGGFNFGGTPTVATTKAPSTLGGMFGASQPTTGGNTGFSFGGVNQPAAPANTASSGGGTGFNFGGLSQPAAPASTASSGGTGFSFGGGNQPAASTTSGGGTGFNFGGLSQPAAPAGTAAGFSLTVAPPAAAASTIAPPSIGVSSAAPPSLSTAASTGFGGLSSTGTAGSLLPSSIPAASTTTTASTAGFGGFGYAATSTATTTASTTSSGFGSGLSFGGGVSTAGTTVTTSASGQKQMTFRQLEETINKWSTELEEQEKYFLDQATQVNAWDRIVMDNGEKIIQLNTSVEKVKLDQQKLDHELDFVHGQQRELEDLLVPLEKALDSMPPISYQQHADVEREHTYMLAENLDAQLKRMGQDLKEIIERLNSNNSKPEEDDPVQQITKILNAHVVSLMWVDRNTANLQKRIDDISRQMDSEKREQERNFRLAYS